jgi:hypothetical protein
MHKHLWASCAVALLLTGPAWAEDKKEGGTIELEVKGTLMTGIAAIGGETTGVLIRTKQGFGCEVAGVKDDKLNGKTVVVKGTFAVKPGVEIRQRSILTASSVKAAEEKPDENYVKAKITGKVQTGVAAPGGQTTGKTITAGGATWELDTKDDKELAAAVEKLNGKPAEVTGTVEVKKLTTRPGVRTIVTVTAVKPAEK